MAQNLGTTTSGTYVYRINNYMNQRCSNVTYNYYYLGDVYDDNTNEITDEGYDYLGYISNALAANYVPILRSSWYDVAFPYYSGYSSNSAHYVVVKEINWLNNTVTVVDPHFDSAYRGTHIIPMESFVSGSDYSYIISTGTMQ